MVDINQLDAEASQGKANAESQLAEFLEAYPDFKGKTGPEIEKIKGDYEKKLGVVRLLLKIITKKGGCEAVLKQ